MSAHPSMSNQQLFTPLNELLLKRLLYGEAVMNPRFLASTTDGVSRSKAYQFARTFREAGFLAQSYRSWPMKLVNKPDLLARWLAHAANRNPYRIPVRHLFSAHLVNDMEFYDYAITGFASAEAHGVLYATWSERPEIYVIEYEPTDLGRWDLEEVAEHQAEGWLIPTKSRSVINRIVEIDGRRYVDLMQVALDCRRHAARGLEQAEFITKWRLE